MRKLIVLFLFLNSTCVHSQDEGLFPIVKNGLWGYMNSKGETVIKPQFAAANKFSEGLAAVRINGTYGYINTRGSLVIPAIYDFAQAFNNNYALVHQNTIPQVIRNNGQPVFKNIHPELTMVNENRFIIRTTWYKKGIVDARGKLVVDTIFTEITPTGNNQYIVRGVELKVSTYSDDVGLIDENGRFIVPYGTYRYIWPFKEGLARVQVQTPYDDNDFDGFIDNNGKLVIKITDKKIFGIQDFNGGFSKVGLTSRNDLNNAKYYEGFLDKKGRLAVNDQKYREVYRFADNRAFVLTDDSKFYILDRFGKPVNNNSYRGIGEEGFVDGKAFVAVGSEWHVIDTNGNVLMKKTVYFDQTKYINNVLFYYRNAKWGFWNLEDDILPKITFDSYDPEGFHQGLLLVQNEGRLSYINRNGKKVWEQEPVKMKEPVSFNIDYMNRGYYYAYSSPADEKASGGWAVSRNTPLENASYPWIEDGKLNLHLSDEDTVISNKIIAKKLFIINETSDTAFFPAQDSRLYLTIQALNEKGEWRNIEYLPSSWCGNSYHTIHLAPGEYWKFATPVYTGGFKTKLRAALKYQHGNERGGEEGFIFSNEFEGSINPAQFWRKPEYQPGGLMDPYID